MKWKAETRNIGDLHENEKNPRQITKAQADQLQTSIKRFGVCEPLVINTDGTILGGHQRCRILRASGKKTVDVYVPDRALNKEEADELTIRLNKNGGDWDYDCLADSWDPDNLLEWGFDLKDLGMEDPIQEEKPYKATVTLTFDAECALEDMLPTIRKVLDGDTTVTYRVKRP